MEAKPGEPAYELLKKLLVMRAIAVARNAGEHGRGFSVLPISECELLGTRKAMSDVAKAARHECMLIVCRRIDQADGAANRKLSRELNEILDSMRAIDAAAGDGA